MHRSPRSKASPSRAASAFPAPFYGHVRNKVGFGFEPLGEHQVKNIPEPVTVYSVSTEPSPPASTIRPKQARRAGWGWSLAAAAAAIVLGAIVGTVWWYRARTPEGQAEATTAALPLPDQPSIAVLPFDNLSADPEQEYFADGITEDLITDLSKTSGLFVIARNSSFRFKDTPFDPQQVARDLGVRYLLEGSVRRVGDQVRIKRPADRYDHQRPCVGRAI